MTIEAKNISVRDLSLSDIQSVLNYWFHSPPGFIEAMGVDLKKLPTEEQMRERLTSNIGENSERSASKLHALTILFDGKPIGMHTIFPLTEGDSGIFHAHIWDPEFRRRGIGIHSYPKACRIFFERFDLRRILFKTPKQNSGAIRVKEKLGIRVTGEEIIGFGIIKEGTLATVFELTRDELPRI